MSTTTNTPAEGHREAQSAQPAAPVPVTCLGYSLALTPRFARQGCGTTYLVDVTPAGDVKQVDSLSVVYSAWEAESMATARGVEVFMMDFRQGQPVAARPVEWDTPDQFRTRVRDGSRVRFRALGTVEDGGKVYRCEVNEWAGGELSVLLRHLGEASRGRMLAEHLKPEAREAVLTAYRIARKFERLNGLSAR